MSPASYLVVFVLLSISVCVLVGVDCNRSTVVIVLDSCSQWSHVCAIRPIGH